MYIQMPQVGVKCNTSEFLFDLLDCWFHLWGFTPPLLEFDSKSIQALMKVAPHSESHSILQSGPVEMGYFPTQSIVTSSRPTWRSKCGFWCVYSPKLLSLFNYLVISLSAIKWQETFCNNCLQLFDSRSSLAFRLFHDLKVPCKAPTPIDLRGTITFKGTIMTD